MRRLVWVAALLAIGCRTHAAPEQVVDGGLTPATASQANIGTAPAIMPAQDPRTSQRMRRVMEARAKRATQDSRVTECIDRATDGKWETLSRCFDELKMAPAEVADAGHKLGAVRPPLINPAWAVTDWYVSASGNDNNTCVTVGSPCLSFRAIYSRLGGGHTTEANVLVTIHQAANDHAASDPFVLGCIETGGVTFTGELALVGTPITVASGTLSAATNLNRTTPAPYGTLPVLDLGVAAAGFVGDQFQFVDTTRGSMGWVIAASGNVITTSPLMTLQPAYPAFASSPVAQLNNAANGDSWVIRRNPKVTATQVKSIDNVCGLYMRNIDAAQSATFFTNGDTLLADEANIAFAPIDTSFPFFQNCQLAHSTLGPIGFVYGGTGDDITLRGNTFTGLFIDGDFVPQNLTIVAQGSVAYGALHFPFLSGGFIVETGSDLTPTTSTYLGGGTGVIWGGITSNTASAIESGGKFFYHTPASSHILGAPTLQLGDFSPIASAWATDLDQIPIQFYWRPVSVTSLDTAIGGPSGTGHRGIALGNDGVSMIASIEDLAAAHTPTNFVSTVPFGGTGIATCAGGTVLQGNGAAALSCLAPGTAGNVLTSVGGVWASAANAAASCPISLASCVSGVLPVVSGGTGIATCTSGGILQGAGTSTFTCTAVAAHATLIAENTGVVVGAAPSTAGFVYTSNGANADPSFQATVAGVTVAAGADITVTGGPAYTVAHSHGTGGQANFTNAAGNTPVWASFSADLSCATTPGSCNVVGLEGIPFSGSATAGNVATLDGTSTHVLWSPATDARLPAPGSTLNVLQSNGSSWNSQPLIATSMRFGQNTAAFTSSGAVVNVAQATGGGPSSGDISGLISFFVTCTSGAAVNVGIGIGGGCSTPAFTDSHTINCVSNGSGGSGTVGAGENYEFGAPNGTQTICALVSSTNTSGTVSASIVVLVGSH